MVGVPAMGPVSAEPHALRQQRPRTAGARPGAARRADDGAAGGGTRDEGTAHSVVGRNVPSQHGADSVLGDVGAASALPADSGFRPMEFFRSLRAIEREEQAAARASLSP